MRKQISIFLLISLLITSISGCSSKKEIAIKPTPSSKPIPAEPFSFEDLISNAGSASYWAWKKSSGKVLAGSISKEAPTLLIGPNTVPDNSSPQLAFNLASRLYADFKQTQKITLVYYQYKDVDWAQGQIKSFLGNYQQDWQKTQAANSCRSERDCLGAVAITHPTKPAAIILVTASELGKYDVNHTSGTVEAHEYTHIIQDKLQGRFLGRVPRWHAEGEAEFAQAAAIYHLDFENYTAERQRIIKELVNNTEITESWLVEFLNPSTGLVNWQSWDKYSNWRLYDVGMLVTEILTSLKGPESTMSLSSEVGKGLSYQKAFEKIYGISWKSAVPLIAQIIYAEINS